MVASNWWLQTKWFLEMSYSSRLDRMFQVTGALVNLLPLSGKASQVDMP